MMLFTAGLLVGIFLSCVVAWFAASSMQREHDELEALSMRRRNELSQALKDRNDKLLEATKQLEITTGSMADWKKEAEVCCERRESLIRELKILLENNQ